MPRKPETRIAKLTRVSTGGGNAHNPFYFTTPDLPTPRSRRSNLSFIGRELVPEFEGEEAWFLMEKISTKPWICWKAIRQVEPPAGNT